MNKLAVFAGLCSLLLMVCGCSSDEPTNNENKEEQKEEQTEMEKQPSENPELTDEKPVGGRGQDIFAYSDRVQRVPAIGGELFVSINGEQLIELVTEKDLSVDAVVEDDFYLYSYKESQYTPLATDLILPKPHYRDPSLTLNGNKYIFEYYDFDFLWAHVHVTRSEVQITAQPNDTGAERKFFIVFWFGGISLNNYLEVIQAAA